jgi:polygalacturonase
MAWPLLASIAALWPLRSRATAPSRQRGGTRLDVGDFGATGDGTTDDTSSFQRAIDALPADGGTVHVAAGTYAIDATRNVRLRSRMHLELAPGAVLAAIPNDAERAYVVLIQDASDVEVSGGSIRGERAQHLGSTGEWGHGLTVRGASRVSIHDMRISDCWGDGISIGSNPSRPGRPVAPSEDVVVARVTCTNNRRQGLTIGRSRRVQVLDSEFSGTAGTPPAAGIDVEPDSGDPPDNTGARDVLILRCRVHDNHGPGIQIFKRTRGVRIEQCELHDNGNSGVLAVAAIDTTLIGNRMRGNRHQDVAVRGGSSGLVVRGNRFDPGKPWMSSVHVSDDSANISLGSDNSND